MAAVETLRLIPDCRIFLDGKRLAVETDAALAQVVVDLDVDLFGECALSFHDPELALINGRDFVAGKPVEVQLGFAHKLVKVFEGEVVALEPQFRRDLPPALRVVCQESLHRLALCQATRALNDVDDKQIVTKIAQEHGLQAEAPSGSREHVLQGNVSDAVFLRRLAQKTGNHVRIEGGKLVLGPPPRGEEISIGPADGLKKMKVKIKAAAQVGEVTVHGWDPQSKREIVGRARPEGETGEGARQLGGDASIALAGDEPASADTATAEAMARGHIRLLAERFVTADLEMIGDPRAVPGAMLKLDKLDDALDGTYRVDHATHVFDKHGYRLSLRAARVKKKEAPGQRSVQARHEPERRLFNPRWGSADLRHAREAEMLVDAEHLEGREILFRVEHQSSRGWERWDEVRATVWQGRARALVTLDHPAVQAFRDDPSAPHHHHENLAATRQFRFHATATGREGR